MPPQLGNFLGDLTSDQASKRLDSSDYVALPVGSFEQHAKHLPLSTDTLEANYFAQELADNATHHDLDITLLPALPFGYSDHHENYPGTVSLSFDTLQSVLVDIGAALHQHDVDRLLFVNHHGGNTEPIKLAADTLARDIGIQTHVVLPPLFGPVRGRLEEKFGVPFEDWGHAGPYETSMIEVINSDLIVEEMIEAKDPIDGTATRTITYFDEITDDGGIGDPIQADAEFIRDFIDESVSSILEHLKEEK